MNAEDSPIRPWLASILGEKIGYLDRLIAAVESELENPTPVDPTALFPPDVVSVENIRNWLERTLTPEQLTMLDHLVSQLDRGGEVDDDAIEDYGKAVQARQGGAAGMGQEETGNMYAHDEMRDLRLRLRASGVPVGDQPNLQALRHLARSHPNMRGAMAMDQARSRPELSLRSMFPALAKRFRGEASSFAVYPDRERQRAAASSRMMALDSRTSADDRLSIERMFPDIARRLKIG
jgi:hypothetical protein